MTEGPKKASKKFSECGVLLALPFIALSVRLSLSLCFCLSFCPSVSLQGLCCWDSVLPSLLHPGPVFLLQLGRLSRSVLLLSLSLPTQPSVSLSTCTSVSASLRLHGWAGEPSTYSPPLGLVHTRAQVESTGAGVCVGGGALDAVRVPTSSDTGTQSNR